MGRRSGIFWTLAGCFALAVMLAFAGTPSAFAGPATAGMSAPPAPATSIEATASAKLIQPQFDWHGHALRPSGPSVVPNIIRAVEDADRQTGTARPHYGPLYRRPPPSFS